MRQETGQEMGQKMTEVLIPQTAWLIRPQGEGKYWIWPEDCLCGQTAGKGGDTGRKENLAHRDHVRKQLVEKLEGIQVALSLPWKRICGWKLDERKALSEMTSH